MTENATEYQLLSAGTAAELSELVNQYLAGGYEVLGAPFSSPAGTVALLQAVIKRGIAEAPPAFPKHKIGGRGTASPPFQPKTGGAS